MLSLHLLSLARTALRCRLCASHHTTPSHGAETTGAVIYSVRLSGLIHQGLSTAGTIALISAAAYELVGARVVLGCFADNSAVLKLAVDVSLPTALCMVGFSMMMVAIQLLNSCGRNTQGTIVAFIACWVVGVSLSLILGLVGLVGVNGLAGIWWGNALGLGVGAVHGIIAVWRVDFYEEARAAQQRIHAKGLL